MVKNDLLIVGGGAAGAAAAVYAARRNIKFKLLTEGWGGEVARSGVVANYPGFSEINGLELAQKMRQQLEKNQVEILDGVKIEKIQAQKEGVILIAKEKKFIAKTVLIATGSHPRKLNIPGEEDLTGRGVTYCTTCDGPLYRHKKVAVIGGGNTALEAALMMAELASEVNVINLNAVFSGEKVLLDNLKKKKNVQIFYQTETMEILGEAQVSGIRVKNLKTNQISLLPVEGVMVHIGALPNSDLTEVKKNKFGEIIIDLFGRTSNKRIWAAGDVTNHPYKQIVVAAGQGVVAVLNIVEFLNRA